MSIIPNNMDDPYRQLWCNVILSAIKDYKKCAHKKDEWMHFTGRKLRIFQKYRSKGYSIFQCFEAIKEEVDDCKGMPGVASIKKTLGVNPTLYAYWSAKEFLEDDNTWFLAGIDLSGEEALDILDKLTWKEIKKRMFQFKKEEEDGRESESA